MTLSIRIKVDNDKIYELNARLFINRNSRLVRKLQTFTTHVEVD